MLIRGPVKLFFFFFDFSICKNKKKSQTFPELLDKFQKHIHNNKKKTKKDPPDPIEDHIGYKEVEEKLVKHEMGSVTVNFCQMHFENKETYIQIKILIISVFHVVPHVCGPDPLRS